MPSADPSAMAVLPSKPFSIKFGSAKPKSTPVTAPKKRPHSALAEPDSDHEDEDRGPQLVSAFDQSGAVVSSGVSKAQAPLVIQVEKNRDWREESRKKRRKNLLPAEVQAAQQSGQNGDSQIAHVERDEVSKVSGIQFVNQDQDGDMAMPEKEALQQITLQEAQISKTADEEAMEALLGSERKSTLQIPALEADDRNGYQTFEPAYSELTNEDDRFKADVASRPDGASLDDYAAIPVEEFGAALLRGMGWKDGEAVGKRRAGAPAPKEPMIKERRPALLGIGAKETPGGVGDEFGAWGKAAKGKRKTDLTYNPVLLQNSKTGEMLTEEELQKKKEEQMKGAKEEDWRERRDKNLRIDQERKLEKRGKERYMIEDGRNGEKRGDYGGSKDLRRRDPSWERERMRDRSRSKERRRRDPSRDSERRKRNRSRDGERRKRDQSRDGERRRRDRSSEYEEIRHSSSRRRSRSKERSRNYGSSRRERSRSAERRQRRY